MVKWFSEKDKPANVSMNCNFCHDWITEENFGLLLKTADAYHWKCLLKLKNELADLERRLNQERTVSLVPKEAKTEGTTKKY